MNNNPIGIFDSGIGGLTVVKEIFEYLPNESICYFGDTARVPYGEKSDRAIKKFTYNNINFLLSHKVKIIVIACNTATAVALNDAQKKFKIPIIGVIESGIKGALKKTKNKRIGIIGTYRTISTNSYKKVINNINKTIKVYQKSCPLFVPLVEEGFLNKKATYLIVSEYLNFFKKKKVDTLILGCTHYPLLQKVIQKVMTKKVVLINSAKEVAKQVYEILAQKNLLKQNNKKVVHNFFVSDYSEKFESISKYFLGKKIENIQEVDV